MYQAFRRAISSGLPWSIRAGLFAALLLSNPICRAQDAAKKAPDKPAEKAKPEGPQAEKVDTTPDRFEDPLAAAALQKFPTLSNAAITEPEKQALKGWSQGQGAPDLAILRRFVQSRVYQLGDRKNIKALEEMTGKPEDVKALERAAADLLDPLLVPQVANTQRFRTVYVGVLIEGFKPLWKGNLHSRTMAMIVLSRSGDPLAIKTFADQLADPDQVLIVKLLACVGISNVAQHGHRTLDATNAVTASTAVSEFLTNQPNAFWPAQFRALEALGSLRQATPQPVAGKAEYAEVAMTYLTDANATPDVRVWAAWALGMMQIPQAVQKFNFPLVAHAMGELAADLVDRILQVPAKATPKLARLADLMLQLNRAFAGEPELRDSGLMHSTNPAFSAAQAYVVEVDRRVKDLTKLSLALSQAVGNQAPKLREELTLKLKDMRTFLAKSPQEGKALFVGGAEFAGPAAKVADGVRP